MTIGIVILCVTLAVFLGLGIWLGVTAQKPILPAGIEQKASYSGITCIVRSNLTTAAADFAKRNIAMQFAGRISAAVNTWCINQYHGLTLAKATSTLRTTRVLILDDAAFEQYRASSGVIAEPGKVNGFQMHTPQRVGSGPVLLVFRGSLTEEQWESLAVHEACHALATAAGLSLQENNEHGDLAVWGPDGIEATAMKVRI